MKITKVKRAAGLICVASMLLCSCAITPPETPLQAYVPGINQDRVGATLAYMFTTAGHQVVNQTTNMVVVRSTCKQAGLDGGDCYLKKMLIGNSGWSDPYVLTRFTFFSDSRGTNVTASSQWCSDNAFGRSNCETDTSFSNKVMRVIFCQKGQPCFLRQ